MRLLLSLAVSILLFCYALSASTGAPNTSQTTAKSSPKPTTQPTPKPSGTTSSAPVTTLAPKEVNYEALIIACSVVGGILLLGLTICICCCCCCKKDNSAKYAREDARIERQKADRKTKNDEKKAERKAKTDEIRRKYGLIKEDNAYQRFDNN